MKNSDIAKDIDEVITSQNKDFFNKKRILLFTIFFIATIGIIALTLVFVLKIDFSQLYQTLSEDLKNYPMGQFYIVLLCLFCLFRIVANQAVIYVITRQDHVKISLLEWIGSACTYTFISCVAPVGAFGNAYNIFWLKTKGYSTYKSTAVTMVVALLYFIAVSILAIPCFISICVTSIGSVLVSDWIFWIGTIGFVLNLGAVCFMICFLFWKRISYWFSLVWNFLKKIVHLKYHTKEQTYKKYFIDEKLTQESKRYLFSNKWATALALIIELLYFVLMYLGMPAILTITIGDNYARIPNYVWNVFSTTAFAVTASNFVPIPGGEGTIPSILHYTLFHVSRITIPEKVNEEWSDYQMWNDTNNTIFIWRFLTYYLVALVSIFGFIPMIIKTRSEFKNHKVIFVE